MCSNFEFNTLQRRVPISKKKKVDNYHFFFYARIYIFITSFEISSVHCKEVFSNGGYTMSSRHSWSTFSKSVNSVVNFDQRNVLPYAHRIYLDIVKYQLFVKKKRHDPSMVLNVNDTWVHHSYFPPLNDPWEMRQCYYNAEKQSFILKLIKSGTMTETWNCM